MTPPDDATLNYIRKICLVGDPAVGKTSLVKRFVLDKYDDAYISTIGAKVLKREVDLRHSGKDYHVSLMVWDVMGQKHFKIIESVAFLHVKGGLITCDMTRKETFDNMGYWIDALTNISGKIPLIILANKSDLADGLQVTRAMLDEFSARTGIPYFITSAKTGENVEAAFLKLAESCLEGAANEFE